MDGNNTVGQPGRGGRDPGFVAMPICSAIGLSLTGLACLADQCSKHFFFPNGA